MQDYGGGARTANCHEKEVYGPSVNWYFDWESSSFRLRARRAQQRQADRQGIWAQELGKTPMPKLRLVKYSENRELYLENASARLLGVFA